MFEFKNIVLTKFKFIENFQANLDSTWETVHGEKNLFVSRRFDSIRSCEILSRDDKNR